MKNFVLKSSVLAAALVVASFSGCAEKQSCNTVSQVTKKAPAKVVAKSVAVTAPAPAVSVRSELYPPNAVPGHCYARVMIPAKYKTVTEKVLVKDAGEKVQVIPAKYGYKTQKLLVKEASERIVPVPATYKTVTEKVLVTPASEKIVTVPATYKTVTEKVLVEPASTGWKKGNKGRAGRCSSGDCDRIPGETGEVMCLVNKPAKYRTITKRVLATPATTKSIPVPAVYKTITKRVIATPATTKTIPIPPVYKTVKVKTIVQPASTRKTTTPPVYKTVTKKVKVSDASLSWKETKCKSVRY